MSTKTAFLNTAGAFFHIYNRGVSREKIFFSNRNYLYFVHKINKYYDPSILEIIAYCLMPNHFHFIVRQVQPFGISQFFKSVCGSYVKAVNKERKRTGHLFEGKYKIKQIDSDEYLLHLSRYIHLNPVRAGLVPLPQEWEFSSCKKYYGITNIDFISSHYVTDRFKNSLGYKTFIEEFNSTDKTKIK